MTSERTDILVQTNPGTPAGSLLRSYWQPVALAEEVAPGGDPLSVAVMGQQLVLFRDDRGRLGLLDLHCSHRGADLSYGRLEDGGLRCLYHGWLFDVDGNCLQQPAEPPGSTYAGRVRHGAYPTIERAGIVFAYLGSGSPPLFPDYPVLDVPDDHLFVVKAYQECNYLQANEGNIDPSHLSFLHRIQQRSESQYGIIGEVTSPQIETEVTAFGLRIYTLRHLGEAKHFLRVSNFVFPNLSVFPGPMAPSGETYAQINWHVPIDDFRHFKYLITCSQRGPIDRDFMRDTYITGQFGPGFRYLRNRQNRYLQDRSTMDRFFAGVGPSFPLHDLLATEGQGPIQNRAEEHLGYGDKAIIQARQLLADAVARVQAGEEAPFTFRKSVPHPRPRVFSEVVTGDWRAAVDRLNEPSSATMAGPAP